MTLCLTAMDAPASKHHAVTSHEAAISTSTSKLFHFVLVLSNDEGMCLCLFMISRKWTFEGIRARKLENMESKHQISENSDCFSEVTLKIPRVSEVCFCSLRGENSLLQETIMFRIDIRIPFEDGHDHCTEDMTNDYFTIRTKSSSPI